MARGAYYKIWLEKGGLNRAFTVVEIVTRFLSIIYSLFIYLFICLFIYLLIYLFFTEALQAKQMQTQTQYFRPSTE